MGHVIKQLGQLRPANTTAATIYSPGSSTESIVRTITVCNLTASAVDYSIFDDDDGTTYDESTALYFNVSLAAKATENIEVRIAMNDPNGNLAVKTETSSALNFTCFGEEFT